MFSKEALKCVCFIAILMLAGNRMAHAISDSFGTPYPPVIQAGTSFCYVAVDASGNRYVAGSFVGDVDFNPMQGIDERISRGTDVCVTRYNANGTYAWTQVFGGSSTDLASAIALSPDGQTVYVGGIFKSADAQIGSGPVVSAATSASFTGYVIALNTLDGSRKSGFGNLGSGILKIGGTDGYDAVNGLTVTGSTLYACGTIASTDVQIGGVSPPIAGNSDAFVVAVNPGSGAPQAFGRTLSGIQTFGGSNFDTANAVLATPSTVYVTGFFSSNDAMVGGAGTVTPTHAGTQDMFVLALKIADGSAYGGFGPYTTGVQTMGGTGTAEGIALAVVGQNVFVAANFNSDGVHIGNDTASYAGPGFADAAVIALDGTSGLGVLNFGLDGGGFQAIGGTDNDYARGIAFGNGSLFVICDSESSDFGFNTGGTVASAGVSDAYVACMNPVDGSPRAAFGIQGTGIQSFAGSGSELPSGIALASNVVYVAGKSNSTDGGIGGLGTIDSHVLGSFMIGLDSTSGANVLTNNAPSDIALSNATISGNIAAGAVVGNLSSTDPNSGNTFTYSLVSGPGNTDNTAFVISGNALQAGSGFNFKAKSSLSIRVRSTDQGGLFFEKVFAITVTNVNGAPTDITLAKSSIVENNTVGATIGDFSTADPDAGDTFTYTLVPSATGTNDNSSFSISANHLNAGIVFNAAQKNSYSIRVRSTDAGGLFFEKAFTVTISPGTVSGVDFTLSGFTVADGSPAGTAVGSFNPANGGPAQTYALAAVSGATDNASFSITGNTLATAAVANFNTNNFFTIGVRGTDARGNNADKLFIVSVTASPNSGGDNVKNLGDGTTITNPDGGLTITVISSNGGLIQLGINVDALLARANPSIETEWGDIAGRTATVKGLNPAHKYIAHGIFIAKTSAYDVSTGTVLGKGRKTLVISAKEVGETTPGGRDSRGVLRALGDPPSNAMTTKSLKGKFIFSAGKSDNVSYSGTIQLPANLDIAKPHELAFAVGNIVVNTQVDAKGKGKAIDNVEALKSLKITYKGIKKGALTKGGEIASVTAVFSAKGLTAAGFDTEGISPRGNDIKAGNTAPRDIQIGMLLDGVPYQATAHVTFALSKDSEFGTIQSRK